MDSHIYSQIKVNVHYSKRIGNKFCRKYIFFLFVLGNTRIYYIAFS